MSKPGQCGYIDNHGDWNPIVDLNDAAALAEQGLTPPPDHLGQLQENKTITWSSRYSHAVSGKVLELKAGMSWVTLCQ